MAKPDPLSAAGPPVHLVDVFPTDGCGSGPDDCTVPTNVALTLRFDRFLNPVTAIRQALQVYPGDTRVGVPFTFDVVYDPIERVVEYRVPPGAGYRPSTLYQVELFAPKAPGEAGIRAIDGAPLAEGGLPLKFSFFTGESPLELPAAPPVPSCDDIVEQVFGKLGACAGAECHRKGGNALLTDGTDLGAAPHQLWLDTTERFALSAIGRVARQTDLGDTSGGPSTPSSERFGVRMSLIEPSSPAGSYLLYKLLIEPSNYEPCSAGASELCADAEDPPRSSHPFLPLAHGATLEPAPEELQRLRDWFVLGEGMPRENSLGARGNVRLEGLRALASFIAAGARCSD